MKRKSIAQHRLQTDHRRTNVHRKVECNIHRDVACNIHRDDACNVSTPSPAAGWIDLPTFPDSVYENLPALLQKVVDRCDSNEERDMMLLGSLVTLGSCLPNV